MIPALPQDKANHFIGGLLVFMAFGLFTPFTGIMAAIIVGVAKEWWDSLGNGHVELKDFLATAAGGAAGYLCTYI